jgi:hypothetical protein
MKIAIKLWKDRRAQNKNTFIKVLSCYCHYEDTTFIRPKTYMQLGFSNGTFPPAIEVKIDGIMESDEHYYRAHQLYLVYLNLEKIRGDTMIKVNFKSRDTIITSPFNEVIPEREYVHINHWLKDFYCMENLDYPKQMQRLLCPLLKNSEDHMCPLCVDEKQKECEETIIEE